MIDILRGWNERSFPGWKAWWLRVMGVGALAAALQAFWNPSTPFSLYLVTGWILALATLLLGFGQFFAWAGKIPPRATLAGLLRYAPFIWLIPTINALVTAWFSRADGSVWWIAPSGFFPHIFLSGCSSGSCFSLGLTIFGVGLLVCTIWILRRFGWGYGKAIGGAVLVYLAFWTVLSTLSFTAWSRLSSYGTTLAAPNQIVEQAFNRTWTSSIWYTSRQLFWTIPSIGNQSARILIGSVLLWMLSFGLIAPLFGKPDLTRLSWRRRLHEGTFLLPPLLLGALLGFRSTQFSLGFASVISGIFIALLTIACWRGIRHLEAEDGDADTLWLVITMVLLGIVLTGWPSACAVGFAFLIRRWGKGGSLWEKVLSLAGSSWLFMVAAWSYCMRVDWGVLPIGLFFGLFLLLVGLAIWQELAPRLMAGEEIGPLFGVKGPVMNRSFVWGVLFTAILLFWLTTLSLGLIWMVVVLAVVSGAILWLFPQRAQNVTLFSWFVCVLVGIVLHSFR